MSDESIEGKPAIVFYKEIGGKLTAVTYDSAGHKELRIHTMYKGVNKNSLPTTANANALAITSTTSSGTASNSNISSSTDETSFPSAMSLQKRQAVQMELNDRAKMEGSITMRIDDLEISDRGVTACKRVTHESQRSL